MHVIFLLSRQNPRSTASVSHRGRSNATNKVKGNPQKKNKKLSLPLIIGMEKQTNLKFSLPCDCVLKYSVSFLAPKALEKGRGRGEEGEEDEEEPVNLFSYSLLSSLATCDLRMLLPIDWTGQSFLLCHILYAVHHLFKPAPSRLLLVSISLSLSGCCFLSSIFLLPD